jgi:hypothetical protein
MTDLLSLRALRKPNGEYLWEDGKDRVLEVRRLGVRAFGPTARTVGHDLARVYLVCQAPLQVPAGAPVKDIELKDIKFPIMG